MQTATNKEIQCIDCGEYKPINSFEKNSQAWLSYYIPICRECKKYNSDRLFWNGCEAYLELNSINEIITTNILKNETPGDAAFEAAEYIYYNTKGNKAPQISEYLKENNYYIKRDEIYFDGNDEERMDRIIFSLVSKNTFDTFYYQIDKRNLDTQIDEIDGIKDIKTRHKNEIDSRKILHDLMSYIKSNEITDKVPHWLLENPFPFSFKFPLPNYHLKLDLSRSEKEFIEKIVKRHKDNMPNKNNNMDTEAINILNEALEKSAKTSRFAIIDIHIYLVTFLIKYMARAVEDYYNKNDEVNSKKISKIIDKLLTATNEINCSTNIVYKLNMLSDNQIFKVFNAIRNKESSRSVLLTP